ncbi:Uncharacterised protein [Citrobacter werkmanii]|uniref:Uncharacterized protein n=1 Tax=Citrobacter werkmanii TaxID=67827 RepID=A0ABM8MW51_9ENTR|nr:Uncharacterised protein [Citrobacter werkmanii]
MGIVSACLSVQAMLLILDAGCSQIMPRDIAKSSKPENTFAAYFWIYFSVAFAGTIFLINAAGWLAHSWFNAGVEVQNLSFACNCSVYNFSFSLPITSMLGTGMEHRSNLTQILAKLLFLHVNMQRRYCFFVSAKTNSIYYCLFHNNHV